MKKEKSKNLTDIRFMVMMDCGFQFEWQEPKKVHENKFFSLKGLKSGTTCGFVNESD
jgi:hypothetical protein